MAKARGDTPHNDLYGEAPPERCTVFRLQISNRVGNPVILVFKKALKDLKMHVMAVIKAIWVHLQQ